MAHEPAEDESPEIIYERFRALLMSDPDNEKALDSLFMERSSKFQVKVFKVACERNDASSAKEILKYVSPSTVLKTTIKEKQDLTWWVDKFENKELDLGVNVKKLLDKAKKKDPDSKLVRELTKVLPEKYSVFQAEDVYAQLVKLDKETDEEEGSGVDELVSPLTDDQKITLLKWEESQAKYRALSIKEFPEFIRLDQVVDDWKKKYENDCLDNYQGDAAERQLLSVIKVGEVDDAIKAIDAYSKKATASLDFLRSVRRAIPFSLFQWLRLNRSPDVAEKLCREIYVKIIVPFCGEDKAELLSWAINAYQPIDRLFSDQTNGESELTEACLCGNRAALKYLLEEVEPVERRPAVAAKHLYYACMCHNNTESAESEDIVRFLLTHIKNLNSVLADDTFFHQQSIMAIMVKILPKQEWDAVLKYACKEGKIKFLEASALCGVSVDSEDYLKAACENNPCFDGHYKVVAALLAKGVKITEALLNSAAIKDDMMRAYLRAQAGLMSQGELNATLLEACKKGHEECVRLLLEKKADPNVVDKNGDSALTLACVEGRNPAVIQLLLRNKANQATRVNGSTDLRSASLLSEDSAEEQIGPVLQDICEHGTSKEIQVFLAVLSPKQKFGALTYIAEKQGNTTDKAVDALFGALSAVEPEWALMFASRSGNVGALKKLLADTRDLNKKGVDGMTALIRACMYGHHEAVALLLGDERIDPNDADLNRYTALMFACANKDMKMVQLLLDCKRMTVECINFKNWLHMTALQDLMQKLIIAVAETKDDIAPLKEIVTALVEHGADPAIAYSRGNTVMGLVIGNADRFEDKRDVKDLVKLFLEHGADPSRILSHFSQQRNGDEVINLFMKVVLNGIQDETMRNKIMDNYRYCTKELNMSIDDPVECYRAMKALVNDLNAAVPYKVFVRNRAEDSTPAFVAKIFDVGEKFYDEKVKSGLKAEQSPKSPESRGPQESPRFGNK